MDNISTGTLFAALACLLACSAFFSASETAMMAINRYRLRHAAESGHRGARRAKALIDRTERLLGVILLGNNLVNAASGTLSTVLAIRLFGDGEVVLMVATLLLTFLILVFSEVTPKVLGASYPERIAYPAAYVLTPLLKLVYPLVWFINLFVQAILKTLRLKQPDPSQGASLGLEELRTIVLESSTRMPREHHRVLVNLLELEDLTVEDVMTPRSQIEAIDLSDDVERLRGQIRTSHHTRLIAHDGDLDSPLGVLHVRRALHTLTADDFDRDSLRASLAPPYFAPAGTPLFTQLQNFQESRERLALVVDEYGELRGLVTLEDLLEEMVGEFTTHAPSGLGYFRQDEDGSWLVEGSVSLRQINRRLGLDLPTDGPKTLNGLLLERFEDIPEAGVSLKLDSVPVEIVQTQGRVVKMARILVPTPSGSTAEAA